MTKTTDYNLQSLKAFLAVSATGSMTAAAAKLGLTQSAISQAIRQLEDALGTVVLDRSHRPLALTPAGVVLQKHAQPIIDDAEALTARVRQAGAGKIPELKIGVIDSFASTVGPSLIKALLKTATTHLSFRSGLAHDQAEGLLGRNLDFIVISDALDDIDGLERHLILNEPFMLLLPEKLEGVDEISDLKRLAARHALIRFSARSQTGAQIERHLRRLGIRAARLLEVDATDSLVAMVAAGLGWAIVTPLCLLQVRAQTKGVKPVPLPPPAFSRQVHLITRTGEYGDLPQRISNVSCEILRVECIPELRRMVPWLRNQLIVGS